MLIDGMGVDKANGKCVLPERHVMILLEAFESLFEHKFENNYLILKEFESRNGCITLTELSEIPNKIL